VAEGPGWATTGDLTVEAIRDNWDAINAQEPYTVPKNPGEQMGPLIQHLGS
ncbi:MAG: short-chain dehydrogenase, partial [Actinomadura rubrobrunea]|nr:short-chain dehydrogenase [Actinomadura rubrobrunea]